MRPVMTEANPDLLNALYRIRGHIITLTAQTRSKIALENCNLIAGIVREAIAKAEGGQP